MGVGWLGETLTRARRARGLTIQALATAVGCERAALSMILHGHRQPSEALLRRLARALEADPDAWVFRVRVQPHLDRLRAAYPAQWAAYVATHTETPPCTSTSAVPSRACPPAC